MAKTTTSRAKAKKKTTSTTRKPAAREAEVAVANEEPDVSVAVADEGMGDSPIDEETHAKYEEVKRGELHITDLQNWCQSVISARAGSQAR